jgi:hypothetical protein
LIFHAGRIDLGPELFTFVGRRLRGEGHVDSCWPLLE